MQKAKKIIIINVHSTLNIGDHALLIQTMCYLEKAFGNVEFIISANWPDEKNLKAENNRVVPSLWNLIEVWNKKKKPRYQLVELIIVFIYALISKFISKRMTLRIIPPKWNDYFKDFNECDLIVAVAGNQMFSSGKLGWPLPVLGFPIILGWLYSKKIYIFPQSIGPFRYFWEKSYVRFVYNLAEKIFIRDAYSLELSEKIKINQKKTTYIPDIAFTLSASGYVKSESILSKFGYVSEDLNIGLTVISKMSSYMPSYIIENYYASIANFIMRIIPQLNAKIFIFCQVSGPDENENDEIGINILLRSLDDSSKNNVTYVKGKLLPNELKSCYGKMDYFIATRMHSGIFALSMGVPTIMVGYLNKTEGLMQNLNLLDYFIDINSISEDQIYKTFNKLIDNKENYIKLLEKNNAEIIQKLDDFIVLIQNGKSHEKN